jgi:arylsulfatase B
MTGGGHNYFPEKGRNSIQRNGIHVTEFSSPYLTDFFTDEGVKWIETHKEKPWFLFMSYNAPHTPMQAKEEDMALFTDIKDKGRRTYAAMMYALDRGVGRLIKALKKSGELENTLIVFFSDNGGATTNHCWRGPYSGSKGNMREGGIHIPMFWYWKGHLKPGRTDAVISSLDLLPTFLAVADSEPIEAFDGRGKKKHPRVYDGYNVLPVLEGKEAPHTRRLFWRLQGQCCVLDGEDKLIRLSHRPAQLFRPFEDKGEQNDLSAGNKERAMQMYDLLLQWEGGLPTYPHFYTSPFWIKMSAKNYDEYVPVQEPE